MLDRGGGCEVTKGQSGSSFYKELVTGNHEMRGCSYICHPFKHPGLRSMHRDNVGRALDTIRVTERAAYLFRSVPWIRPPQGRANFLLAPRGWSMRRFMLASSRLQSCIVLRLGMTVSKTLQDIKVGRLGHAPLVFISPSIPTLI